MTSQEIKKDALKSCLTLLVERAYLLGRLDARHDLECNPKQLEENIKQIIEAITKESSI